jgi:hypothetical protein
MAKKIKGALWTHICADASFDYLNISHPRLPVIWGITWITTKIYQCLPPPPNSSDLSALRWAQALVFVKRPQGDSTVQLGLKIKGVCYSHIFFFFFSKCSIILVNIHMCVFVNFISAIIQINLDLPLGLR